MRLRKRKNNHLLFLLCTLRIFAFVLCSPSPEELAVVPTSLEESTKLLISLGFDLSNICHLTSDSYAPEFPKCSTIRRRNLQGSAMDEDTSHETEAEIDVETTSWAYLTYYIAMSTFCIAVSSIMAGLLMGLMTLEPLSLHILIRTSEDEKERRIAEELLPLVERHHLMLVSILLVNCYAAESLPVFLSYLMPEKVAVLLSVVTILIFGEIIPSAVFTGPNQVQIAGRLTPIVRIVIFSTFLISYPMSKLLDALVVDDDERNLYNRGELSALIRIHYEERMAWKRRQIKHRSSVNRAISSIGCIAYPKKTVQQPSEKSPLLNGEYGANAKLLVVPEGGVENNLQQQQERDNDEEDFTLDDTLSLRSIEVNMAQGALQMRTKTARDIYRPMRDVFSIPYDAVLNDANLATIYHQGFTRIPVYERHFSGHSSANGSGGGGKNETRAIRGILYTKHLILVDRSDDRLVSTLPLLQPPCVSPDANLIDLLDIFQSGTSTTGKVSHMAIVCEHPDIADHALDSGKAIPRKAGVIGIITLEDVMEELLQQNILDEMDRKEREDMDRARWAIARWKLFVKKRRLERQASQRREGSSESITLRRLQSRMKYRTCSEGDETAPS
jgi:metal transporter CNNM